MVRETLRGQRNLKFQAQYPNIEAAFPGVTSFPSEILLLAVSSPAHHGLTILRALKQAFPYLKVMIVSEDDDPGFCQQCITQGASGFLVQGCGAEAVGAAPRFLSHGGWPLLGQCVRGLGEWDASDGSVAQGANAAGLSIRQSKVLEWFSRDFSAKEVADHMGLSTRTVHRETAKIFKKLQVHSRVAALQRVRDLRSPLQARGSPPPSQCHTFLT